MGFSFGGPILGVGWAVVPGCALLVNPAADRALPPLVEDTLAGARERAVAARARRIEAVPDLGDPARIEEGAGHYDALCVACHGAPGREPDPLAAGLSPPPPDLAHLGDRDPRETYWVVTHGIQATGMPAWGAVLAEDEIWSLTAFVHTLPTLSPQRYASLTHRSGSPPRHAPHGIRPHGHPPGPAAPASDGHAGHGAGDAPQTLLERVEARNASGTAWQPETTPMTALHGEAGPIRWMAHGNVFVLYDAQGSARGDRRLTSVNWVMGHADVGDEDGAIGARAMLSAEPLTVGGQGYPVLGQTGETWQGRPLVDRQHPHDLFMELALLGRQTAGDTVGLEVYAALAGEPALGPAAFPHRASALAQPLAPLGHHWQDSTHISFGVVTVGAFAEWAKLEGSWFNGREPDEVRTDLDLAVPDSWSTRLTVSLLPAWVVQVSGGRLAEPEPLEPGVPQTRLTASTTFDHDGRGDGNFATTLAWGRTTSAGEATDSVLLEADLGVAWNEVFGRLEYVTKEADELGVAGLVPGDEVPLVAASLGDAVRFGIGPGRLAVGAQGNVLLVPRELAPAYGGRIAPGAVVFLQVRPGEPAEDGP